ncbi:MAG: methylenetetrahydrofolate reductase C-terminal domain-containing protein [Candidatus Omnitrophota bacterium]
MIITKQKKTEDIMKCLEKVERVFIIGCTQCATVCKTGGEDEVRKMKEFLEASGKKVTAAEIWDTPCNLLEVKKRARDRKDDLSGSQALLLMSCGDGAHTVSLGTGMNVVPANDTLFLGQSERAGKFNEVCALCGDCTLFITGGYCPNALCPKGLQNGPCGGVKDGKCEVSPDIDCGWLLIYNRLKDTGNLDKMKKVLPPKDYSKSVRPRKIAVDAVRKR